MHHVPYTHRLHSGKTVIQYIYDSHYEGAAARRAVTRASGRRSRDASTTSGSRRCGATDYQAGQAIVWRDAVSRWFHRASGIADARGRVDNYPGRIEAESATLTGYVGEEA